MASAAGVAAATTTAGVTASSTAGMASTAATAVVAAASAAGGTASAAISTVAASAAAVGRGARATIAWRSAVAAVGAAARVSAIRRRTHDGLPHIQLRARTGAVSTATRAAGIATVSALRCARRGAVPVASAALAVRA